MRIKWRLGMLLITLSAVFSPVTALAADPAALDAIARQLVCQCGCTAILSNCAHGECMVRDQMNEIIRQRLDKGQSQAEIIGYFIGQYGEQVLSEPPKKGFNLVGWIAPFAAILVAGAVIVLALKKWAKRGAAEPVPVAAGSNAEDEEYRRRVEKELQNFNEGGFR